ncbi:MAG: hypothetical protein M3014_08825 [Chloroflexota bacterium]|nr:hypothetical protein [Chloroflexota bacterium]
MSERGLVLALQRFHEDPGFAERVAQDPQSTLELYDLDESECQTLITAAQSGDTSVMRQMAQQAGLDWGAEHMSGVGHLAEAGEDDYTARFGLISEIVTATGSHIGHSSASTQESTSESTSIADTPGEIRNSVTDNSATESESEIEPTSSGGAANLGALPGDGYEGVHPQRVQGS